MTNISSDPRNAMKIRFPDDKIAHWAERYRQLQEDADLIAFVPQVRRCGAMSIDQLRRVAQWKSPRGAHHVEKTDDDYVRTMTAFALRTTNERARIEVLTLLDGVSWPTASVILHFFHCERYPILDFRALWSVGEEVPSQYTFKFWWDYVRFCREAADRTGCDMRTLDRALWAYSEANQPTPVE